MAVLLVPGLANSGPRHWQSLWEDELPDALRVEQADWDRPDLESWLARLAMAVLAHPGSILVGHSLGAVLVAHLGARFPHLPVAGAMLVAPADPDAETATARTLRERTRHSFANMPLAPLPFTSVVIGSRNDPYMSLERARGHANLWDAAFVDAGLVGHINVESGHGPWADGLVWLQRLRSRATIPAPLFGTAHRPIARPVQYRA